MQNPHTIKRPLLARNVAAEVWYAGTDREIRSRAPCDAGGKAKVGVGLLQLPPGSRSPVRVRAHPELKRTRYGLPPWARSASVDLAPHGPARTPPRAG